MLQATLLIHCDAWSPNPVQIPLSLRVAQITTTFGSTQIVIGQGSQGSLPITMQSVADADTTAIYTLHDGLGPAGVSLEDSPVGIQVAKYATQHGSLTLSVDANAPLGIYPLLVDVTAFEGAQPNNPVTPAPALQIAPVGTPFSSSPFLYVLTNPTVLPLPPRISTYALQANGKAVPFRVIQGTNTGLHYPGFLALDGSGSLYVVDYDPDPNTSRKTSSILVYSRDSDGNSTPSRIVKGSNVSLAAAYSSIAVDGDGNVYVIGEGNNSVLIYPPMADGNVPPVRTITTGAAWASAVALDSNGDLYVLNWGAAKSTVPSITAYDKGGVPYLTIAGDNTSLYRPTSLAFDGAGNIYVLDFGYRLLVYRGGQDGDVAPIHAIDLSSFSSDLLYLAVDNDGNLYVGPYQYGSIAVLAPTQGGNNVTLTRSIQASSVRVNLGFAIGPSR
jgi:sugar lactone lactonase YvrE